MSMSTFRTSRSSGLHKQTHRDYASMGHWPVDTPCIFIKHMHKSSVAHSFFNQNISSVTLKTLQFRNLASSKYTSMFTSPVHHWVHLRSLFCFNLHSCYKCTQIIVLDQLVFQYTLGEELICLFLLFKYPKPFGL